MKYVITGSIGNISRPLIANLKAAGKEVTVVTSHADRVAAIEALGAKALVGSLEDPAFVQKALADANAAYLMVPPKFNLTGPFIQYQKTVADNYLNALRTSSVTHVVALSSIGAHLGTGVGPVDGIAYLEQRLAELKHLHVKTLRPSYFMGNLMGMIPMVKHMNIMGSNFGSTDEKLVLVHPDDIAAVATEEMLGLSFTGHSVRYISGDEQHPRDIAKILGAAVGKPELPWVEFKDADALAGMTGAGLSPFMAEAYVTMGKALREGRMQEHYWKNKPAKMGKTKLADFAKVFAQAYQAS